MTTRSTCKPGSAWHVWQLEGVAWRAANETATDAAMKAAGETFAAEPGWPDGGQSARYRAFIEGATPPITSDRTRIDGRRS